MALSGIETLDLSPYVSAGIAAAGPSLSGTGGVPLGQSLLNNQEFLQKPALTPQIATELMQRAMVTGVPTYEFQPYGGFEAVKSAYDKGGGSYDLGKIAAPTLQNLASRVATSGTGNLAALELADLRLAPQAITAMQQSGIAPSTLSGIRALDIAPIPTGYEYFAPSQVSSARDFLSTKPTADQIYQRAAELKLSPSQTSSLLSLANKVDLKAAADAVNQYLKSTGKTLPGGFTTSVPDYYKSGIANLPTTGTTTGGTTGGVTTLSGATDYNALINQAYKDVLGRTISPTDPGFSYYLSQLQSGAIKPSDLASSIAYGSTSLADQLAAQRFLKKDIFGTEADLRSKYQTGFDKAITDVFGSSEDIKQLESLLSKDRPFELSKALQSKYFESAGSLEDIRKQLQESNINKEQEANRAARTAMSLYGIDVATAQKFKNDLYEGKVTDPLAKEYYDALIKGTVTPELQQKLLTDAAKKAPDSPYFKANPQDLLYAKPAGDLKRGEETSGQYGNDPKYGFALISKTGGDKALDEKGDVVLSGLQDLRENTSLQYIGADPHSAWAGAFARGTGALGVTASKDEITDFARIEKELNRLGGVQRQVDPDTGSAMDVVYVERKDPESDRTYKVPVTAEEFFRTQLAEKYPAVSEEDPSSQARFTRNFTSTSAYDYYKQTKDALDKIATGFYKDPAKVPQYGSIKEAYNDLNDKYKDLYLWSGRTDTLDPEAMKKLGIEDPTANDSHIQVYLEPKGDWLVPKTKKEFVDGKIVETPMINPFKFSDPNTTAGVLGDTFNNIMEILAIPPISMALGAYLAGGPLAAAAESLGGSILQSTGLDFALAEQFNLGLPQIINLERQIGSALLNSGIGALPAAAGGDFDKFGKAFLTNLAGSGVQLGSGMLLPEGTPSIVPKALGVATTAGLSGRDLDDALARLGQSEGLKTLLSNVPTGDFNTALISAFMPSILSGNLTPQDVVRIAQAINPPKK